MILFAFALLGAPALQSGAIRPGDAAISDDPYPETAPVAQPTTGPQARPGETPRSTAGQAGRRQTREQVARDSGIEPMARIESRIQNRAQTRLRNRIDRYYDPQANATSPFVVAGEQARTAGRRRR